MQIIFLLLRISENLEAPIFLFLLDFYDCHELVDPLRDHTQYYSCQKKQLQVG